MPGGSMGLGFNHQLVMERCRQISETNTKDERMRKSRKIPQTNFNGEDSSVKGHSRKHLLPTQATQALQKL